MYCVRGWMGAFPPVCSRFLPKQRPLCSPPPPRSVLGPCTAAPLHTTPRLPAPVPSSKRNPGREAGVVARRRPGAAAAVVPLSRSPRLRRPPLGARREAPRRSSFLARLGTGQVDGGVANWKDAGTVSALAAATAGRLTIPRSVADGGVFVPSQVPSRVLPLLRDANRGGRAERARSASRGCLGCLDRHIPRSELGAAPLRRRRRGAGIPGTLPNVTRLQRVAQGEGASILTAASLPATHRSSGTRSRVQERCRRSGPRSTPEGSRSTGSRPP